MTASRRMPIIALVLLALAGWLAAAPVRAVDPDKAFHHYVRNEWSIQAGLPMPTVAVAPHEQPNAFATGRQSFSKDASQARAVSRNSAKICVLTAHSKTFFSR